MKGNLNASLYSKSLGFGKSLKYHNSWEFWFYAVALYFPELQAVGELGRGWREGTAHKCSHKHTHPCCKQVHRKLTVNRKGQVKIFFLAAAELLVLKTKKKKRKKKKKVIRI